MARGNQEINQIMKNLFAYARKESEVMYALLRRHGVSNREIARALDVNESGIRRKYKHVRV